jgi:CHAD domain-containing protein
MAFQLKAKEPVPEGITRNVKAELEKALGYLSPSGAPRHRGVLDYEATHEVRKCFKRVRAALRLVREGLGDDLYHQENVFFRDSARPLSLVRDADVLIETVGKLAVSIEPAAHAKIHKALVANRQDVARRVLDAGKAFAIAKEDTALALARLPKWKFRRDGWAALEPGLRRVYRRGHYTLAVALEKPNVENLHGWRKQTKYLWHELQLLEGVWTGAGKELIEQTHELSTLLGEDHDLAVLRQTLAADPLAYGGPRVLKRVLAVMDRRRVELELQAFASGANIYKDPPKAFTTRIGASVSYGRQNEESQPLAARRSPPGSQRGDYEMKRKKRAKKAVSLLTRIETLLTDVLDECVDIEKNAEKNVREVLLSAQSSISSAIDYFSGTSAPAAPPPAAPMPPAKATNKTKTKVTAKKKAPAKAKKGAPTPAARKRTLPT